jgi:hypothetical protein
VWCVATSEVFSVARSERACEFTPLSADDGTVRRGISPKPPLDQCSLVCAWALSVRCCEFTPLSAEVGAVRLGSLQRRSEKINPHFLGWLSGRAVAEVVSLHGYRRMIEECRLDQLQGRLAEAGGKEVCVQVLPLDAGAALIPISLLSPARLHFDPDCDYAFESLTVSGCAFYIDGLHLRAPFLCKDRANCELENCEFGTVCSGARAAVLITTNSVVTATKCQITPPTDVGYLVEGNSSLTLNSCVVSGTTRRAVRVITFSSFFAEDTSFVNCAAHCLSFEKAGLVEIRDCTFQGCRGTAVAAVESRSVFLNQCCVRDCHGGTSFGSCEAVIIARCSFHNIGQTVVVADKSSVDMRDLVIDRTDGNGINVGHHTKLIVSRALISGTKFPAIAICDDSRGTVSQCRMTKMSMNGVVVRMNSRAWFSNCWIEGAGQHTVSVSDSRPVCFSRCYLAHGKSACMCIYNTSHVVLADCLLVGQSPVGIDVFTGARCDGTRTVMVGIKDTFIHVHHGGSARFAKVVFRDGLLKLPNPTPQAIVRGITFNGASQISLARAIATESEREVVVLGASLGGSSPIAFTSHLGELPEPPRDIRHPSCEQCGEDAGSCLFSPCGHAKYCRRCWDNLPEKPTICPLCMTEITKVLAPVDCSREGSTFICPICTENDVNGFVIPCGHAICNTCAAQWFDKQTICPYCRSSQAKFRPFVWHS